MTEIAILSPTAALATTEGWQEQKIQWETVLNQKILPASTDSVAKCVAISKLGEERFGWGPMDSVTKIVLIQGNIELKATTMMELMQQRAVAEGGFVMPVERSMERAAIRVQRPGWPEPYVFEYLQDDAKTARLWGKKGAWSDSPKDMLWARCVSRVSRGAYADVTGGAYAMGELPRAHERVEPENAFEAIVEQVEPEPDYEQPPEDAELVELD